MTQQRAHDRLLAFLGGAQARGHVLVLVITGKGRSEGEGVLKTMVPRWLAEPAFRELVVAYEHASRHHGGEGALYVRLRRSGTNRRRPDGGAGAANRLASLPKWST
ncbi:Smr/MutS family protein [Afifella sp. YEN Y35]